MGSAARRRPKRLAEKLLEIRVGLGLSQNGLIRQMGFGDDLTQAQISMFERGIRQYSVQDERHSIESLTSPTSGYIVRPPRRTRGWVFCL
jgi:transcriptional regulator with XRE-family HTH domain